MSRTKTLGIRVSAGELGRLEAAAAAAAMNLATWVLYQALSAAPQAPRLPAPGRAPSLQRAPEKLARQVSIRLTEEAFEALDEHARACGLTLSSFVRKVLAGRKPNPRRPSVRSAIVAVNRAGNNLNQVVQLASHGTLLAPDLSSAVAALRKDIHALRDALLTADATAAPEVPE
jgi:uncharacterized protein (DUF1778 family)